MELAGGREPAFLPVAPGGLGAFLLDPTAAALVVDGPFAAAFGEGDFFFGAASDIPAKIAPKGFEAEAARPPVEAFILKELRRGDNTIPQRAES